MRPEMIPRWGLLLLAISLFSATPAAAAPKVIGENEAFRVLRVSGDETYESLAARFLDGPEYAWRIAELNGPATTQGPRVLVIPKGWHNPSGVNASSHPLVPILTYHRFGPRPSQLMVTPEALRAQLSYLRDNNYAVVPLQAVRNYIAGTAGLPKRAVVITIDDGYQSTYKLALPILQEFGVPATVFVYTDFANRGGLTTAQMRSMLATGLIEIQSHSKTHTNLAERPPDESDAQYLQRLQSEVAAPKQKLERLLDAPVYAFAYPYGAANSTVIDQTVRSNHDLALTVNRGGNAFYNHPQLLKRSMVFGSYDLKKFARMLRTERNY